MIRAVSVTSCSPTPSDYITLTFDERHRRRITMVADGGLEFLLDLPQTTQLLEGDNLVLEDGRYVGIIAAAEALMRVKCDDMRQLLRTAWHIGNRHLPCEIRDDCIIVRQDHVIEQMLVQLGCEVEQITEPFNPEGGAYGQGRTHGHEH